MKAATLLFFAFALYLLGAIAHVLIAPIEAVDLAAGTGRGDLQYSLIPLIQSVGAGLFVVLALLQLLDDVIGRRRSQDSPDAGDA